MHQTLLGLDAPSFSASEVLCRTLRKCLCLCQPFNSHVFLPNDSTRLYDHDFESRFLTTDNSIQLAHDGDAVIQSGLLPANRARLG